MSTLTNAVAASLLGTIAAFDVTVTNRTAEAVGLAATAHREWMEWVRVEGGCASSNGGVPCVRAARRFPRSPTARPFVRLGRSPLLDDKLLPNPAAATNRFGGGLVAYIPAGIFRDFNHHRFPFTRMFIG